VPGVTTWSISWFHPLPDKLADSDVMSDCMVAEPVPLWQRSLWKYAFLGRIVRGKMRDMMGINAENVRFPGFV
jgi:hypothetical protein